MNEEELEKIVKHSRVLANTDIYELKESDDVIQDFNGVSLISILQGRETFQPFERLIRMLHTFFKYDVDLYPPLLDFFVKNYVLKLQYNDITFNMATHPVLESIKKAINNDGLYDYVFTGDVSNLTPFDIFRSTQLLQSSTQHFKKKAFTSKVVAKKVSFLTTPNEVEEMFVLLEMYPFDIVYEDLMKASIGKDNVALLNYLVTKHEDKESINGIMLNRLGCVSYSASKGSINCLKYLRGDVVSWIWDKWTCIGQPVL